jgi:hypothetical protein
MHIPAISRHSRSPKTHIGSGDVSDIIDLSILPLTGWNQYARFLKNETAYSELTMNGLFGPWIRIGKFSGLFSTRFD